MTTKRTLSIASATLITVGLSLGQAGARMHHTSTDEARKTLREIEVLAVDVEDQADQLGHISQDQNLSAYSHLTRLNAMKDEVNQMGRELAVLEAERDALPSWEQKAIDDTLPMLKDAAENTGSAIEYFNESRTHLWTPDFRGYANRVYEDSRQIAKSLKSDLRYDKVRDQERRSTDDPGIVGGK